MSHSKERAEKVCLNCGAALIDRYCHKCGQENVEPQQSFWHLAVHFFNDFTHFDGKFFSTIKLLMLKPGFLSLEYMKGRRAKYLDPIRMYIFTSAVAFLIIFSLGSWLTNDNIITTTKKQTASGETITVKPSEKSLLKGVSLEQSTTKTDSNEFLPTSVAQYDSLQRTLPDDERDRAITRYVTRKIIVLQGKYKRDGNVVINAVTDKFVHSFPQIFFISLPFFALILFLLHIRRRKKYYFVSQVIFSVHFYCACYILLIITTLIGQIPYGEIPSVLISSIIPIIYLYAAMRKFYMQGVFKTVLKLIIAQTVSGILILILFFIYLLNSIITVADKA